MNKLKENKNGFTLIEVIISIAIVSFLSIYLVQIFITAKNLNSMTYDLDNAVNISKSVIESLASGEALGDKSEDIFLKNAIKLSDEPKYIIKLGEDFEPTDSDFVDPTYIMNINLIEIDRFNSIKGYALYDISVDIIREQPYFMKTEINKHIYTLNASKELKIIEGGL